MSRLAPLLLLFALLCSGPARAEDVVMLVYPNLGLFDVGGDGRISGSGADLLARMGVLAGVRPELQAVPAARALQMIGQQPGHCTAGLARTPEREALYRWAGPMAVGELVLYGRAGETREVNGPQDLTRNSVVVQRNSQALAWLQTHKLQAHEVNDTVTGLRMLRAGRVDYWLANSLAANPAIQRTEGEAPKPLHVVGRVELFIACHRDMPPGVVERLQTALTRMRRDGELDSFNNLR